jgi:hypothetical protein
MMKHNRRTCAQYYAVCGNLLRQLQSQGITIPEKTKTYLQDVQTFRTLGKSLDFGTNASLGQSLNVMDSLSFVANTDCVVPVRPWHYAMTKELRSPSNGQVPAQSSTDVVTSAVKNEAALNTVAIQSLKSCGCPTTHECWCNTPRFHEDHLFVCFLQLHTESTIQAAQWDKLLDYFSYLGAKRVCLITHNTIDPLKSTTVCNAKRVITRIRQEQLSISCISFDRLCYDPSASILSPRMKRLNETEKQAWCIAHPHIDIKRLQRLILSDPLCRQHGFEEGDLVYAENRALEVDYFYVTESASE